MSLYFLFCNFVERSYMNEQKKTYWDPEPIESDHQEETVSPETLRAILMLQTNIRLWLAIKVHLRKKANAIPGVTSIQIVQASIRRFGAQQDFIRRLQHQFHNDHMFLAFVSMLSEKKPKGEENRKNWPLKLIMYSKQKGDKGERRIYFDDKTHSLLCWQVRFC